MTQSTSATPPAAETAMLNLLYSAPFAAQMMRAFAKLRIADHLTEGPRSAADLTQALGAHPGALTSFLNACTAQSLVTRSEDGQYALTERGRLLRSDSGVAAHVLYAAGPGVNRAYEQMDEVVLTGRSGGDLTGRHVYDYYSEHLEEGAAFEKVMSETTTNCVNALVETHDFTAYPRIMDVGGGRGTLLSRVLEAAPKAQGVLFDMPHVIDMARSSLREEADPDVVSRIEFTGGSFLESVPPGADLYMIKSILVDWPDSQVARLLANLHSAMAPGGRLLVVDWFGRDAAEAGRSVEGYEAIVSFSAWTLWGGRLRVRTEFESLLDAAGFTVELVETAFAPGLFPWNLIVARPKER
ncbi:acetylserotonin O-methyltransferase [Streptomyces sp. 135]|uniref:acetylserotonin O-methyltransferase n=1 Tax=Streptomyces sp. 135 TaxID=2838850 RepID=UPI001CBF105C|nr:acetylserotonin O-methyltransferase [Streptomyces sp. 135]